MTRTLKILYVLLNNQEEMLPFRAKHLVVLLKVIAHQEKQIVVDFGEMQKKLKNSKINQTVMLNLQGIIVMKIQMTPLVHR